MKLIRIVVTFILLFSQLFQDCECIIKVQIRRRAHLKHMREQRRIHIVRCCYSYKSCSKKEHSKGNSNIKFTTEYNSLGKTTKLSSETLKNELIKMPTTSHTGLKSVSTEFPKQESPTRNQEFTETDQELKSIETGYEDESTELTISSLTSTQLEVETSTMQATYKTLDQIPETLSTDESAPQTWTDIIIDFTKEQGTFELTTSFLVTINKQETQMSTSPGGSTSPVSTTPPASSTSLSNIPSPATTKLSTKHPSLPTELTTASQIISSTGTWTTQSTTLSTMIAQKTNSLNFNPTTSLTATPFISAGSTAISTHQTSKLSEKNLSTNLVSENKSPATDTSPATQSIKVISTTQVIVEKFTTSEAALQTSAIMNTAVWSENSPSTSIVSRSSPQEHTSTQISKSTSIISTSLALESTTTDEWGENTPSTPIVSRSSPQEHTSIQIPKSTSIISTSLALESTIGVLVENTPSTSIVSRNSPQEPSTQIPESTSVISTVLTSLALESTDVWGENTPSTQVIISSSEQSTDLKFRPQSTTSTTSFDQILQSTPSSNSQQSTSLKSTPIAQSTTSVAQKTGTTSTLKSTLQTTTLATRPAVIKVTTTTTPVTTTRSLDLNCTCPSWCSCSTGQLKHQNNTKLHLQGIFDVDNATSMNGTWNILCGNDPSYPNPVGPLPSLKEMYGLCCVTCLEMPDYQSSNSSSKRRKRNIIAPLDCVFTANYTLMAQNGSLINVNYDVATHDGRCSEFLPGNYIGQLSRVITCDVGLQLLADDYPSVPLCAVVGKMKSVVQCIKVGNYDSVVATTCELDQISAKLFNFNCKVPVKPCKTDPASYGYIYNFNNSSYLLGRQGGSWWRASGLCRCLGARLVTVESAAEMTELRRLIALVEKKDPFVVAGVGSGLYFIGLNMLRRPSVWEWESTGAKYSVVTADWLPGEPSGPSGAQCVHFWIKGGVTKWNDAAPSYQFRYICEWSPL